MKDITFCLISCGELTEAECIKAIEPWREEIVLNEVRNVKPQVAALNQMLIQTETPYLIPLDADIILEPNALERIKQAIVNYSYDPKWHTILFPLFDTLTEKRILALKLLRADIMKKFLFQDTPTPDVEHYTRLSEAGYTCIEYYLPTIPIGKHVVRGSHFCYHKYKDVYYTLRTHKKEWDPAIFMGGNTLKEKSKNHYNYFLYKYLMTKDEDYLYCIAGMLDGICLPLEKRSKNLAEPIPPIKDVLDRYWGWLKDGSQ